MVSLLLVMNQKHLNCYQKRKVHLACSTRLLLRQNVLTRFLGGKYVIIEADPKWKPREDIEYRELFGIALSQKRNTTLTDIAWTYPDKCPTDVKEINFSLRRDLLLANQVLKYTQSNSVCMAKHGQVIGLAAGQQSRIDCVKLAAQKSRVWYV